MPDLIMDVAIDGDNGETQTYLNREAVSSESHDGRYKRIQAFKYTETFSPKFTFFKKNFEEFSLDDIRATLKWLTHKDTTALLEIYYDDSNVVSWASIGGFVDLQTYKIANNRTIAITATWDSISPFAMSDLYNVTQNVAHAINTKMYYWQSTTVSGTNAPQYLLTYVENPKIGTDVYSVSNAISDSVIQTKLNFYGSISDIDDESYIINDTAFTLSSLGTKIKRTYDNKIVIDIDTDDNKPVYPRIKITHAGSVVPVTPETVYTSESDMVPSTVYFNGTTYYWKTVAGTNPTYFHSSDKDPGLSTTSVKLTNTHTDFFGQKTVLDPTVVQNNNTTEIVVIDCANKIISSNSVNRIFGDDFVKWRWLELRDGKNEITIEGNCTVTLEWREVRKVGEY
jgi:hypothetical protein